MFAGKERLHGRERNVTQIGRIDSPLVSAITEAFLQTRLPRLREYSAARKYLTNAAFREMFQVPRVRAVRELNRLVREGYLKLQGKGRGARYVPGHGLDVSSPGGEK